MDIKDKERLSAIYPELSEAQLEEILLAESAGLDVSSLADKSLDPSEMKAKREELSLDFLIEADGGIGDTTIATAAKAGVDVAVAGTAVFKAEDAGAKIAELKALC